MIYTTSFFFFFFFNDTATTEIYTLSLHDALPIWRARHSDSARYAASWVLPVPPGQSYRCRRASGPVRTTGRPGASASARPGTVSGLALKQSASDGTSPERTAAAAFSSPAPDEFAARSGLSTVSSPAPIYARAPDLPRDPLLPPPSQYG